MRSARPRARRGEGEQLREEIVAATERLLIETGAEEAVSIRAVADAVGVTPPSIYRHFTDKSHLIFEVCARHFAELEDRTDRATRGEDDPTIALLARARAYIQYGRDNPEHYRIMFMTRADATPDQYADVMLQQGHAFAELVANVEACMAQGDIPRGDPHGVALQLWAGVHGITSLLINKPDVWGDAPDRVIEDYLAMLARGVLEPGWARRGEQTTR